MHIHRIVTFLEVAETGSIIKAANYLNLTQSAVSTRIKQLEDEISQELFMRSHSGMRLSAAGLRFRPYALRMAQAWRQGRQEAALDDAFEGSISIAIQAVNERGTGTPYFRAKGALTHFRCNHSLSCTDKAGLE